MLTIIDLKISNVGSIIKALEFIGVEYQVIDNPGKFDDVTKIILPGVGSFKAASQALLSSGFYDAIRTKVLVEKVPILGICVGMQLLALEGEEGGTKKGLGFFDAKVKKMDNIVGELVIPHMGWNDVQTNELTVFKNIKNHSCFYFVHSYSMNLRENVNIAVTNYGGDIVAYVNKGHIHGAQFHPEKSQESGLQFLRNFIELC